MPTAETIALASFFLNVLVAVIGLTWGVRRIGQEIEQKIEAHRDRFDDQIDRLQNETGELGHSLRTKIQHVELFVRDTYVRRDSFYQTMKGYGEEMRGQFEKIDARLERMESKIDSKT